MKKLNKEEFLQIDNDNVVAIQIKDGKVKVLYLMEEWEAAHEDEELANDPYRFIQYGDLFVKNDWTLNEVDLSECGLLTAVGEQQGRCCGGMYFYHEEDDRVGYLNAFDHLYQEVVRQYEDFSILKMTNNEWKCSWKKFQDGVYFIVLSECTSTSTLLDQKKMVLKDAINNKSMSNAQAFHELGVIRDENALTGTQVLALNTARGLLESEDLLTEKLLKGEVIVKDVISQQAIVDEPMTERERLLLRTTIELLRKEVKDNGQWDDWKDVDDYIFAALDFTKKELEQIYAGTGIMVYTGSAI